MPVDIGPRIGIDGEAEFRKNLANINQQLRTLGSEMRAVTSSFDAGDRSEQALAAQTGVLNRQIDAQEEKLRQLQKGLDAAAKKFGATDTRTLKWSQAVNDATAELNRLRTQLSRTERGMDDLEDATDGASSAMTDAKSASGGLGETLKSAILGGGIVSGILGIAGAILDVVDSTKEYRKIMASLDVSSERAGYSAEQTAASYRTLYGVLGDEQTAATTTANLQAIGLEPDKLTAITDAAIGAWATYGDSIPIDGLSEAINETIKVGQVTGTFADVLNWAGVSEDQFNERLAAVSDPAERANLVLQQLASQGLVQAGQAWQQANDDIVASNQATAQLTETVAGFGEILSPIVTKAKQGLADITTEVLGVIHAFQDGGFQAAFDQADTVVAGFVSDIKQNAPQMLTAAKALMTDLRQGVVENIPLAIEGFSSMVADTYAFLTAHIPDLVRSGGEMMGGIVQGIIEGIPVLVRELPQVISALVDFLRQNRSAIVSAGMDILRGLVTGLLNAIPELVAALPELIAAIVQGVYALRGDVVDIGADIVRGIWEGITSMAGWIRSKVGGFISGIVDNVKGVLGIHSPSTVFRGIGENMAYGLGNGFAGKIDAVKRNIDRSMAELAAPNGPSIRTQRQEAEPGYGLRDDPTANAIADAVRDALQNTSVYLSGRKVGTLITQQQNAAAVARGQSQVYL